MPHGPACRSRRRTFVAVTSAPVPEDAADARVAPCRDTLTSRCVARETTGAIGPGSTRSWRDDAAARVFTAPAKRSADRGRGSPREITYDRRRQVGPTPPANSGCGESALLIAVIATARFADPSYSAGDGRRPDRRRSLARLPVARTVSSSAKSAACHAQRCSGRDRAALDALPPRTAACCAASRSIASSIEHHTLDGVHRA